MLPVNVGNWLTGIGTRLGSWLTGTRAKLANILVALRLTILNFLGNMKTTIGNYIEVVVLLVLAPTILAFWATFKSSVDTQYQNIIDALTIVVVLGIAVAAIDKLTSE